MRNLTKPKMGCNTPLAERNHMQSCHPKEWSDLEMCHVLLVTNNQRCSDSGRHLQVLVFVIRRIAWIERDMQGTSYDLLTLCSLDIQITYILYTRNGM